MVMRLVKGTSSAKRYRCPRMTHMAERNRMPLMHVKLESLGGEKDSSRFPLVHAEKASSSPARRRAPPSDMGWRGRRSFDLFEMDSWTFDSGNTQPLTTYRNLAR